MSNRRWLRRSTLNPLGQTAPTRAFSGSNPRKTNKRRSPGIDLARYSEASVLNIFMIINKLVINLSIFERFIYLSIPNALSIKLSFCQTIFMIKTATDRSEPGGSGEGRTADTQSAAATLSVARVSLERTPLVSSARLALAIRKLLGADRAYSF